MTDRASYKAKARELLKVHRRLEIEEAHRILKEGGAIPPEVAAGAGEMAEKEYTRDVFNDLKDEIGPEWDSIIETDREGKKRRIYVNLTFAFFSELRQVFDYRIQRAARDIEMARQVKARAEMRFPEQAEQLIIPWLSKPKRPTQKKGRAGQPKRRGGGKRS